MYTFTLKVHLQILFSIFVWKLSMLPGNYAQLINSIFKFNLNVISEKEKAKKTMNSIVENVKK